MFIFSRDGGSLVNSDNIVCFYVNITSMRLYADKHLLGEFSTIDDAKKALHYILNSLEAGATSYQV